MKYSIIISPINKNSNAIAHAFNFIQSILKNDQCKISVFFYGHAVKSAFEFQSKWQDISNKNVTLLACSTIAEKFLNQQKQIVEYISLAGLGQWMESVYEADKNIEFV